MRLLFIGDIVGRPGRDIVRRLLPRLVRAHEIDMVIANGENAAGGAGITGALAAELFELGIDVLTSGNHIWNQREVFEFIAREPRLLRPANYPEGAPGAGAYVWHRDGRPPVGVINLMGRVFMAALDDPFASAMQQLMAVREQGARIVVVDFHAEATSEKQSMGWFLDGRVTAVLGTHTHVQTADDRILPGGTAYITDVGMTGPHDGVIGIDRTGAIRRFTTGLPWRFEPASGDPRLHGVVVSADDVTGRATSIARLSLGLEEPDA